MTVVFDAGQNSEANFTHLAAAGLHYIGSVPASDCPDLTALPASKRSVVDKDRFGGLTAYDTRRDVYGAQRRAILTHSPELRDSQARGFDGTTLAKRPQTRRAGRHAGPRQDPPQQEQGQCRDRGHHRQALVRRVIRWQLDGDQPRDLRLSWHVDQQARTALEEEIFGKHVLITDHDNWPVPEVLAGYRSKSEAEFSAR